MPINSFKELSASQYVSIGVFVFAVAGMGLYFLSASKKENRQFPANIAVEVRPGAAILIPFSRRLADEDNKTANAIYSDIHTDPDPLPVGLSIVHSGVYVQSTAAIGDILLWSPPAVSGKTGFDVSASGEVKGAGTESIKLQSESTRIILHVTGEPVSIAEPNFAGAWSDEEQQWIFAADGENRLTIINGDGSSAIDYDLYPDQNSRWFLVEKDENQPRLYWIESVGDALRVSLPGSEFKLATELRRG